MNIYVGNLSWDLTEQDLQEMFAPYGEVISAKIVTDKFNNNRSKGFGFVEMTDAEAGNAAIAALHGTEVQGRSIVVNESQPREGGGGGSRGGSGYGGGGGNRSGGGGYGGGRGGYGGGGRDY